MVNSQEKIFINMRKVFSRLPLFSILLLIIVPIVSHFLFSSFGYNPTDDGFTLAYSRRIIEGQIPHRDFIIIRPFLSPLLHVPIVLWGGEHTYLLSRYFVWFQIAFMIWAGIVVLQKKPVLNLNNLEKASIGLIAFAVSVHNFPTIAWHTIDGLFLMSIGMVCYVSEKQAGKFIGYLFMGMAYLCKQNFILLAPISLIILGDGRRIKYWLAILLPGFLYIIFLLLTNSLGDAVLQLTSQNAFFQYGFKTYYQPKLIILALIGFFSARSVIGNTHPSNSFIGSLKVWGGLLALSVAPLCVLIMTYVISSKHILAFSFWLFSLVIGVVIGLLLKKGEKPVQLISVAIMFLIVTWSASISIGWPYPDMGSGLIMEFLLVFTIPLIKKKLKEDTHKKIFNFALVSFSFIVLLSLGIVRYQIIFRDLPAAQLTKKLDNSLPGGKGIKTNDNTYQFLIALKEAVMISKGYGETYAIIPDCAGWWAKSPQPNPLPIDWVQKTELNKPELISRVIQQLDALRNGNVVIVQKVEAKSLRDGFIPFTDDFEVVAFVRNHFTKVDETSLFEIYK